MHYVRIKNGDGKMYWVIEVENDTTDGTHWYYVLYYLEIDGFLHKANPVVKYPIQLSEV
jgi:hypothetical protein